MPEVIADSDIPGRIDHDAGAREEALRQIFSAGLEAFAQQCGFLRRHRHALAVDRIEAAQGIADHQISLGKRVSRS